MSKSIDLVMFTGKEYYTVSQYIHESSEMGISKRISKASIPENIVPGVSRLFIKHPKAIVHVADEHFIFEDLEFRLADLGYLATLSSEILQEGRQMLPVIMALDKLKENDPDTWLSIVDSYDLVFTAGVIGYGYLTGIIYEVEDGEEDLPEELSALAGYVEPVKTEY